ncbi:hypothetical protein EXE43_12930 [Halorubrum sp. SS5]|nr:hypothetical protein EXE43_12930 [Halorubrum sp. SS5]
MPATCWRAASTTCDSRRPWRVADDATRDRQAPHGGRDRDRGGRRQRARDRRGARRQGPPEGGDRPGRVPHRRGGRVTNLLWRCGRCDRHVDAFVNGYTCPSCGQRQGETETPGT